MKTHDRFIKDLREAIGNTDIRGRDAFFNERDEIDIDCTSIEEIVKKSQLALHALKRQEDPLNKSETGYILLKNVLTSDLQKLIESIHERTKNGYTIYARLMRATLVLHNKLINYLMTFIIYYLIDLSVYTYLFYYKGWEDGFWYWFFLGFFHFFQAVLLLMGRPLLLLKMKAFETIRENFYSNHGGIFGWGFALNSIHFMASTFFLINLNRIDWDLYECASINIIIYCVLLACCTIFYAEVYSQKVINDRFKASDILRRRNYKELKHLEDEVMKTRHNVGMLCKP